MVLQRPSTLPSFADDSVLHVHHIHELLNERSGAEDDYSSGASEDDELQKEIARLPSAERRVSQEISDLVRLFSNPPPSEREMPVPPRHPSRLHSTTSPVNQIYTGLTKRDNTFATFKHETKRLENGGSSRSNASKKHEVDVTVFDKDIRQSPCHSQPSDEGNGIFGISTREPPQEILFVEDDGTNDASTHFSSHASESTSSESIAIKFMKYISRLEESSYVEHRDQDEDVSMPSEWCLESRQLSELERGENDLFKEESFWEESFWKTPVNQPTVQSTSATMHREQLRKREVSEIREGSRISPSKQDIIEALSMPMLDHKRDNNSPDHEFDVDFEDIKAQEKETDESSVSISENSDATRNMARQSEWMKPTSSPWKSSQTYSNLHEYGLTPRFQTKVNSDAYTLHNAVGNEREGVSTVYKDIGNRRGNLLNWRSIVFSVHVVLNIIGGVVFIAFLR